MLLGTLYVAHAATTTWDFDNPVDYTLSSATDLEVSGTVGQLVSAPIPKNSGGVAYGDLDGDGDLDLFLTRLTGTNNLWFNDGNGNLTEDILGGSAGNTGKPVVGDIDNDGDIDLYAPNGNDQQNNLWINDGLGNGASSFSQSDIANDLRQSTSAHFADIDNDGDLDIYVINNNNASGVGNQNRLWINDGLGNGGASFTASDIAGDIRQTFDAIVVDIDNDGDLDIYAAESQSISTENQTVVTTVMATDLEDDAVPLPLAYLITGGADMYSFVIDSATGVLSFISPPDFENPTDLGMDNVYDIQVTVRDSGLLTDVQDIAVTITDLSESSGGSGGSLLQKKVCKDMEALNYSSFGIHDSNLCEYVSSHTNESPEEDSDAEDTVTIIDGNHICPAFVQHMRRGDRDGEIGREKQELGVTSFIF